MFLRLSKWNYPAFSPFVPLHLPGLAPVLALHRGAPYLLTQELSKHEVRPPSAPDWEISCLQIVLPGTKLEIVSQQETGSQKLIFS